MLGNYLLMMFYTTVAGWMILYFFKMLKGDFAGLNAEEVGNERCRTIGSSGLPLLLANLELDSPYIVFPVLFPTQNQVRCNNDSHSGKHTLLDGGLAKRAMHLTYLLRKIHINELSQGYDRVLGVTS